MNKKLSSNFLVVFVVVFLALVSALFFTRDWGQVAATKSVAGVVDPNIHFLETSTQAVSFDLMTEHLDVSEDGVATASDLFLVTNEAGAPALPYFSTLIALPPNAQIEVLVEPRESAVSYSAPTPIRPAPSLDSEGVVSMLDLLEADALEQEDAQTYLPQTFIQDETIYNSNAFYPAAKYSLSDPFTLGDLTVVRLDLFPIQYNHGQSQLNHFENISVQVNFVGSSPATQTPTSNTSALNDALYSNVLNAEQAAQWTPVAYRRAATPLAVQLPVGAQTYKITVTEDGIYELTYAALQAAGMDVANINPQTLQLMNDGQEVAFEFVGNADTTFSAGESIRFYGWKFDGTRAENRYINGRNIFWLWANGTTKLVQTGTNPTGFTAKTNFLSSVTAEEDTLWSGTGIYNWENLDNEAEDWYWATLYKYAETVLTRTYPVELPHPDLSSAETADFLAEFTSSPHPIIDSVPQPHTVKLFNTNDSANSGSLAWFNANNVNVTGTMPNANLLAGTNTFQIDVETVTQITAPGKIKFNRITVDYMRQLVADDDMLIFSNEETGDREFIISGMSLSSDSDAIVWNITDPHTPVAIPITNDDVIDNGSQLSYRVGSSSTTTPTFIATNFNAIKTPNSISEYTVPEIVPANGADWVAISYIDFIPEANRLAAHRQQATYGEHSTHVVDFTDIVNQYGYGFPTPASIQNYLRTGLQSWAISPRYVVLVGDANHNPGGRTCSTTCFSFWDDDEQNFVITDLVFEDRFDGKIPSDHTFSTLLGDDLIPDLAIGRIGSQTVQETKNAIDKIIQYEQNLIAEPDYLSDIVFMSDNADGGGDFCQESRDAFGNIPSDFTIEEYCMPDDNADEKALARDFMFDKINPPNGASVVNYRGHGGVNRWTFLDTTDAIQDNWDNSGQPVVVLSADCLDGNFAFPGYSSLSETTLTRGNGEAVAAHWSSTGLGYSFEHSVMHEAFYDAFFEHGMTSIGDAIVYSKAIYAATGFDDSELYAFTLQGDPAMQVFAPSTIPEPTPTQTPVSTATSVPTSTPVSTATSTATATSVATATPVATSIVSVTTIAVTPVATSLPTTGVTTTVIPPTPLPSATPVNTPAPTAALASLSLSLDSLDDYILPELPFTIDAILLNGGGAGATDPTMSVTLPAGSSFNGYSYEAMLGDGTAVTVSTTAVSGDTGTLTFTLPTSFILPVGEQIELAIDAISTDVTLDSNNGCIDVNSSGTFSGATATTTAPPLTLCLPDDGDLQVLLTATDVTVEPNETANVQLTVRNNADTATNQLTTAISLPTGTTFSGFTPQATLADGTPISITTTAQAGDGGTITFDFPATFMLPAGESIELDIDLLISSLNAATDCAQVGASTASSTSGNQTTGLTHDILFCSTEVDLDLDLFIDDVSVNPGQTVVFDLELENDGTEPVSELVVTTTLPADIEFESYQYGTTTADGSAVVVSSTAVSGDSGDIVFTFADGFTLPAGDSVEIELTATISQMNQSLNNGCLVTEAVVTSYGAPIKPYKLDSTATACAPQTNLAITKEVVDTVVDINDLVVYNIEITNNGTSPVAELNLTESLPAGLSYVSHTLAQDFADGSSLSLNTTASSGDTGDLTFIAPLGEFLPKGETIMIQLVTRLDSYTPANATDTCLSSKAVVSSFGTPINSSTLATEISVGVGSTCQYIYYFPFMSKS